MDTEWTNSDAIKTNKMLNNDEYFKYIFKKTEKIACTVFYILHNDLENDKKDTVIIDLENSAKDILDKALVSLSVKEEKLQTQLDGLTFALLALESRLRVVVAPGYMHPDVLSVFLHEINSLHRTIRKFGNLTNDVIDFSTNQLAPASKQVPKNTKRTERTPMASHGQNRRETITQFLRDNPNASIKDISMVITDCSEKTIQRELISMIKDNVVSREGERRWSKYSLVDS